MTDWRMTTAVSFRTSGFFFMCWFPCCGPTNLPSDCDVDLWKATKSPHKILSPSGYSCQPRWPRCPDGPPLSCRTKVTYVVILDVGQLSQTDFALLKVFPISWTTFLRIRQKSGRGLIHSINERQKSLRYSIHSFPTGIATTSILARHRKFADMASKNFMIHM